MIIEGPAMQAAIKNGSNSDAVDVCVIGSGCGGATVAANLAERGYSVLILEQGGYYHPARDFDQRELHMTPRLNMGRGFARSADGGVNLRQGHNVGGSSVGNWAIATRTPKERLALWRDQYGLQGHDEQDLAIPFARVEADLGVTPATDELTNPLNKLLFEGADALGWKAERVSQARRNCQQSGHCEQGCAYDAKQSMLVTYLSRAVNAGARLYADCQADMLLAQRHRFDYLVVKVIDRATGLPTPQSFRVEARAFVLAAGGYGTPIFLRRLGLGEGQPHVGEHLFVTPTARVHGIFDQEIIQWRNIPAAWSITEHMASRHDAAQGDEKSHFYGTQGAYQGGGFRITAGQHHPASLASMLPGIGGRHADLMRLYPRIGSTMAWIDDADAGRVERKDDVARITVPLDGANGARLRDAYAQQATLLFAAGATEVIFGDARDTRVNKAEEVAAAVAALDLRPGRVPLVGAQAGGGARMGATAKEGVVGFDHRVHETDNVYIADASVLPTNPGVDLNLTVMAFAHRAADHIADALG